MMLGVWYPRNYILAAIDPREGAAAVKALLAAGFGRNSVRLEDGARVAQIRITITEQRTPLKRAAATVEVGVRATWAASRRLSREHLIGYHPPGIQIGSRIDRRLTRRLLRGHVCRCADGEPKGREGAT